MNQPALDLAAAKHIAKDGTAEEKAALAARRDLPPELLYFLAEAPEPEVRAAVAANPATPRQADTLLARDAEVSVRCALARKLVGAGLPDDERRSMWRMAFTLLEALATDTVVRVRRTIADAIQRFADAPRPVVLTLAKDDFPDVATPVLRSSPVLTDDDLIELVDQGAPDWAQAAIADRPTVSPALAEKLAASGSVPAVASLLNNRGARIGEATLERIIERAPRIEAWHAPLVNRPDIPKSFVDRIAGFVAAPLAAVLLRGPRKPAKGFQPPSVSKGPPRMQKTAAWARGTSAERSARGWESPAERARRLYASNQLTEELVAMALDSGEREFAVEALSIKSGLGGDAVRRVVESKSARSVTALCWKAGFSMRFAMEAQKRLAGIPAAGVLNARNGVDYPLSQQQMAVQLAMFAA